MFLYAMQNDRNLLRAVLPEFYKMLGFGDKAVLYKGSNEFIGFITRLTRNLCNDDQQDDEVKNHWKTLLTFLNPQLVENNAVMYWAFTASLNTIADIISGKQSEMGEECEAYAEYLAEIDKYIDREIFSIIPEKESDLHIIYAMQYYEWSALNGEQSDSSDQRVLEIAHAFDEERKFGKKSTALMCAAAYGGKASVKMLVDKGWDVNRYNDEGATALAFASYFGQLNTAKYLIEKGAAVNHPNEKNATALLGASYRGHLGIIKYLIEKGADVNHPNENNMTALMAASWGGHLETAKYLVEKGATVNHINNSKQTALILAAERGHTNVMNYLLSNEKTNINHADENGDTALMSSIKGWYPKNDRLDAVKLLVEHGADINHSNNDGYTALIQAIKSWWHPSKSDRLEAVKLLVEHGAGINQPDKNGRTALWHAKSYHWRSRSIIDFLNSKGAKDKTSEKELEDVE